MYTKKVCVCVCVSKEVVHVYPSIRMQSASSSVSHPSSLSPSLLPHPSTYLTPPAASNCSHRLILRLWLHPANWGFCFYGNTRQTPHPTPPPLLGTDHVTFRKASPTSPSLLLTLSSPGRCQRLFTAGSLAGFSPLRGFKGKSDTYLISLEDQSSAWSKCWISIF